LALAAPAPGDILHISFDDRRDMLHLFFLRRIDANIILYSGDMGKGSSD
jgi:hypothetical protein